MSIMSLGIVVRLVSLQSCALASYVVISVSTRNTGNIKWGFQSHESRKKGAQEKRDLEKRGPGKKGPTIFGKGEKGAQYFFSNFCL